MCTQTHAINTPDPIRTWPLEASVTLLLSLSLETGGSEQPLKHTDLRLNPQERKSHLLCASQPVPSSSAALVPPSGSTREPSQTCTCACVIGMDIHVQELTCETRSGRTRSCNHVWHLLSVYMLHKQTHTTHPHTHIHVSHTNKYKHVHTHLWHGWFPLI